MVISIAIQFFLLTVHNWREADLWSSGGLVPEGGSAASSSLLEVFVLKAGVWLGRHSQVVVTHSQVVVTGFNFCNVLVKS